MSRRNGSPLAGTKLAATLRLNNGNGLRFTGSVSQLDVSTNRTHFTIRGSIEGPITSLTRRWPKGAQS